MALPPWVDPWAGADIWDLAASPWAGVAPAQRGPAGRVQRDERGDVPEKCIRVHRLNGEVLEVSLTIQEANNLTSNRDLKQCLARHDCSSWPSLGAKFLCFLVLPKVADLEPLESTFCHSSLCGSSLWERDEPFFQFGGGRGEGRGEEGFCHCTFFSQ